MLVISRIEQRMMTEGIADFSPIDTNALIVAVAKALGQVYYEITPDALLQRHKDLKTDLFADDCEEEIIGGFTSSNGHQYRLNRDDQLNMIGQYLQLQADSTITNVNWRTLDDGYVSLAKADWINQVYLEAFKHKDSVLTKYNTIKEQINAVAPINGDYATAHSSIVALSWAMDSESLDTTPEVPYVEDNTTTSPDSSTASTATTPPSTTTTSGTTTPTA